MATHAGCMVTTTFNMERHCRRDVVHFTCPLSMERIQRVCNQIGTMALIELHEALCQMLGPNEEPGLNLLKDTVYEVLCRITNSCTYARVGGRDRRDWENTEQK